MKYVCKNTSQGGDNVYRIDIYINGEKLPIDTLYDSKEQVTEAKNLWTQYFFNQKHGNLAKIKIVKIAKTVVDRYGKIIEEKNVQYKINLEKEKNV